LLKEERKWRHIQFPNKTREEGKEKIKKKLIKNIANSKQLHTWKE
jgi:hypothetical protein